MPRGFVGNAAAKYLGGVSSANRMATNASSNLPSHAPNGPRERPLPFDADEAHTGSFVTGHGNVTNIVADYNQYMSICNTIGSADDKLGECIYHCAQELEALCQTFFILPSAVPRCLNISAQIKKSLGESRSLTEEVLIQSRRFADTITSIGL